MKYKPENFKKIVFTKNDFFTHDCEGKGIHLTRDRLLCPTPLEHGFYMRFVYRCYLLPTSLLGHLIYN